MRAAAALLVIGSFALAPFAADSAKASPRERVGGTHTLETDLLQLINTLRRQHGSAPLVRSAGLRRAAAAHSAAMATRGFFAHDSVGGARFWQRLRPYYPQRRQRLWSVGENLLWATPHVDAEDALGMWLRSSTHRRMLLRARWREVGLAAIHVRSAPGFFGGQEVTILTADFGVRG